MPETHFTTNANPQQLEAITHAEGPLLIIASPGSGRAFTALTPTGRSGYFGTCCGTAGLITGVLSHGQSDFYIQYIDPDSHAIRSDYPDFLLQKDDDSYAIVEVKGANKVDDPVVLAKKAFAEQTAVASGMTYEIIKESDTNNGRYGFLLGNKVNPDKPTLTSFS